jgi:hypothetical protein
MIVSASARLAAREYAAPAVGATPGVSPGGTGQFVIVPDMVLPLSNADRKWLVIGQFRLAPEPLQCVRRSAAVPASDDQ